ncbi:MAG: bifunctional 3-deoxy-7-phosphoheptulonate synthase/chorismate mutase [Actinobacteria bacterium]|nr:bifunctional 3-deoxy-7-phosphoheptulonate synthase/chorismate mutase [Actinomycetota bacterium]
MNEPQNPLDIDQIRTDIDHVDDEIVNLLAERKGLSLRIAHEKGRADQPSRDENREEELIAKRVASGQDHDLDSGLIIQVWRAIVNDSVRVQQEALGRGATDTTVVTVAIQGIKGSYSYLASQQYFGAKGTEFSVVTSRTFSEAIENVRAGRADATVLPIENTTSGAITEVYDLLLESGLHLTGDIKFKVRHCLLGLEGVSIADMRKIYCHPQAIAQCSEFLATLEDCEVVHFSDTALSGKWIKNLNDPSVGAIASEEAARLFDLQVLKSGIANRDENYTRFVVAATHPIDIPEGVPAKTSIVMAVGNHPGALMDALAIFSEGDINLVKLESRPIPHNPREELFYVDFEGAVSEKAVDAVLDTLMREVRFLKVLGSYPSRDLRQKPTVRTPKSTHPKLREALVEMSPTTEDPKGYRLGSRGHKSSSTVVEVAGARFGGDDLVMIAGPCAVESWDQIVATARTVRDAGGSVLRGGCFKPRTSPYSFQGLGFEGLDMLAEAGKTFGLPVVTEVLSPEDVNHVAKKADILQIGTRNMQNFSLLAAVGRTHRPVLLKRGMSSSLDELLQAAEYILAEGNQQVILCERGIRTFERSTRNTLDLSAVPVLKSRTHLPVVVDPSHAAGSRYLVPPLALAAEAIGAHGIMVEIHPDPDTALSDGPQSLHFDEFEDLMGALGIAPTPKAPGS